MNASRLQMIRNAAKGRPALSEKGSALLEELRKEDPDLGAGEVFGEVLAPENVKREAPPRTDDEENEINTEEISPLMRAATAED